MNTKKLQKGESILLPKTFLRIGALFSNASIDGIRLVAFLIPKADQAADVVFAGKQHSKAGEVVLLGADCHWLFEIDLPSLFDHHKKLVLAIRVNGKIDEAQKFDVTLLLEKIAICSSAIELTPSAVLRVGEIYLHNNAYKFKLFQDTFSSIEKFAENYHLKDIRQLLIKEEHREKCVTVSPKNPSLINTITTLGDIFSPDPKIVKFKIAVIGMKKTGKTSLLAAMHDQLSRIHSLSELKLDSVDTASKMQILLEKMLIDNSAKKSSPNKPLNNKIDQELYRYRVAPLDNDIVLILEILELERVALVDDEKSYIEKTVDLIRTSNVLVLTIDSPALVEQNGRWHETINKARIVTDCFKRAFNSETNESKNKLVLLAPVKCEYYVHGGDYHNLLAMVQRLYGGLFNLLRFLEKHVALAITPVQTLGHIHLGGVLENDEGQPEFLFEQHPEQLTYSPRDADQILAYILSFVLLDFLKIYRVNVKPEEINKLYDIKNKLLQHRKQGAEGYKIIQGFHLL